MMKVALFAFMINMVMLGGIARADVPSGESIYSDCAVCHGDLGEGILALSAPALAGQNKPYLVTQLNKFKSGFRGSHPEDTHGQRMMLSSSLLTTDESIVMVAEYIASLQSPMVIHSGNENFSNGQAIYRATCAACHGVGGEGSPGMSAPRLIGFTRKYLTRQLKHFKGDIRASSDNDQSTAMSRWMNTLSSEEDIADVVNYLIQLPNE